ncbi:MAG: hypothetical protein HY298_06595 [Verrucomicrobia bacterium]|nr:hypothetical protein [Verrucomicrobiota bacterium]
MKLCGVLQSSPQAATVKQIDAVATAAVSANAARSQPLRQSILQKAFTGKLGCITTP